MVIWMIPLLVTFATQITNPYVGLIAGVFSLAFFIIFLAWDINISTRIRASQEGFSLAGQDLTKLVGDNARRLTMGWKIVAVVMGLILVFVSCGTWIIAASQDIVVSPLVIEDFRNVTASAILLFVSCVSAIVTSVAVFVRCKKIHLC